MVEIDPIPTSMVKDLWHVAGPLIQKAVDESDGECTLDNILESLLEERRALWMVFKHDTPIAAITTRIDIHSSGMKIATIDYAGGESFSDWNFFADYISPFYFKMGCAKLDIAGRAGWERLHTAKGFKRKYVILRKDLASE